MSQSRSFGGLAAAVVILAGCTDPAGGGSSGGGSAVSSGIGGADTGGGAGGADTGGAGAGGADTGDGGAGAGAGGADTGDGGAGAGGADTGDGGAGAGGADTGDGGAGAGGADTGDGGAGAGASVCAPGATESCYAGPAGTEGVGACRAGVSTCNAEGTALGPCEGEVLPSADDCATPEDEDCDGSHTSCDGGALLWSRTLGGQDFPQQITNVSVNPYGPMMAGHFQGDIKVVSESGEPADFNLAKSAGGYDIFLGVGTRTRRYGGAGDQLCHSMARDALGNVFMTGSFDGALDFGGGPLANAGGKDIFVVKLDGSGAHMWSRRFGGAGDQEGITATVDDLGNLFVAGNLEGSVDFGDGPLVSAGGKDVFAAKWSADGDLLWSRRFGGPGDQRVARAPHNVGGNLVITGSFEETVDFGGGPLVSAGGKDVFVAKLNDAGEHLFSHRYGGPADQEGHAVATIGFAGNVLLTGSFEGSIDLGTAPLVSAGGKDAFIARLDSAGNLLWGRGFGDGDDQSGEAVVLEPGGNALFTGSFRGSVSFGGDPLVSAGGADTFVASLDASGAHVWSRRFGDIDDDVVTDIGISAPPSTSWGYIVGSRCSGAEPGCGMPLGPGHDAFLQSFFVSGGGSQDLSMFGEHVETQPVHAVATDPSGNVLVRGGFVGVADFGGGVESPRSSAGSSFVAKYDAAGNHLWHRAYSESYSGGTIATDASGNVFFINQYGTGDSALIKLDASGNPVWASLFSLARYNLGVNASGEAVIGGVTGYYSSDIADIVVTRFDASGNTLWSRRFANRQPQQTAHAALDQAGNVILTGTFHGPLDFGGGVLPGSSSGDLFIVKLDPAGNHLSSRLVRGATAGPKGLDGAGGFVMLCSSNGTADFGTGPLPVGYSLVKFDAAGNFLWSTPASGLSPSTLAVNAAGEIFLGGVCYSATRLGGVEIPCDHELFAIKLDAAGNHLWSETFGGYVAPWNVVCAGDPEGDLIAGGTFPGRMDLGGGSIGSVGRAEGFLAKLAR
ncbi:hypothetical protein [Sorangium sp. So ce1182]|uniref:hypothetical protein n=1 Tax=Sorangium sp. So ce1182 TaxID=3133334 RepID=UPI003F615D2D